MSEIPHIVVTIMVIITDPVAVSTTKVSTITNDETGTLEPYIPAVADVLASAVGQKLQDMPGVKFAACSAHPWPKNEDGSYAPIPPTVRWLES